MAMFPTAQEFRRAEEITHWRDLPSNTAFLVTEVDNVITKHGPAKIVQLKTQSNELFKAFLPKSVDKKVGNRSSPFYLYNSGLKPFVSDPSKYYYDVSILAA